MKKSTKKALCILLTLIMAVSSVIPAFAMSEAEWDTVWNAEDTNAGITMFPGSDETERNFTWYTENSSVPAVMLSTNPLMLDAKEFTGAAVKATEGDFANHVTITGLEYGSTYYYRCLSEGFESEVYSFTTADSNAFTALYMTDIHVTDDSEENPVSLYTTSFNLNNAIEDAFTRADDISLLISAGDQASDGLEAEYKAFAANPYMKKLAVATSIGNHDRKGAEYKTYANVPNEYDSVISSYIGDNYWFVKNNVLFLFADTNNASGTDHAAFVKAAVQANPDVKFKVLVAHHDLYSGRIPHRESENGLIRMMWAPIIDEYGIDLVLLGHSHYYTVSNVLYNSKAVAPLAPLMTDPEGALYMVSCSINRPRDSEDIGLNEDEIGFDYLTEEPVYNILTCTEDSITVDSYIVGADDAFNSFTITKTSNEGGHHYEDNPIKAAFNELVRKFGMIYAIFNNIGRYSDLKEDGFDVSFFDCLLGR